MKKLRLGEGSDWGKVTQKVSVRAGLASPYFIQDQSPGSLMDASHRSKYSWPTSGRAGGGWAPEGWGEACLRLLVRT